MKHAAPNPKARTAADAISRMPREVREAASRALLDGADWRAVRDLCARAGFPGVTAGNVSHYRTGRSATGHAAWLAREERLEALRRDSEATAAIIEHYRAHGGSPAEAGTLAAAEILARALAGIGPELLAGEMAQNPKLFLAAVNSLARLTATVQQDRRDAAESRAGAVAARPLDGAEKEKLVREAFGLPQKKGGGK